MSRYAIIPATRQHIDHIAPKMRKADAAEVWASSAVRPRLALLGSLLASRDANTGTVDEEPICMFGIGVGTPFASAASPWLLGTDLIEQHAIAFLRLNKKYLQDAREKYPVLSNYVDARNLASIRWLSWLGFTILPAEPYGPFNAMFHHFEMRTENV